MQAIIPDTLQGALILSVIDFFASFIVISGIGLVLALFPLLNRIPLGRKKAADGLPAAPAAAAAAPAAAAASTMAADDGPPLVVIAAAVHAVLGGEHRILHLEPAPWGEGWVAEGRAAQHQHAHGRQAR